MMVVQTVRRPEAVIFDYDGRIADAQPLHCRALRKVPDPPGGRFT